jgi:hypothetical protein
MVIVIRIQLYTISSEHIARRILTIQQHDHRM